MKTSSFIQYLQEEVFSELPNIKFRSMFGGHGMYLDGVIVGLIADDTLYLKVDETNKPDFISHNSKPFVYLKNGKPYSMSYWEIPPAILEDQILAKQWLQKSKNASQKYQKIKKT